MDVPNVDVCLFRDRVNYFYIAMPNRVARSFNAKLTVCDLKKLLPSCLIW